MSNSVAATVSLNMRVPPEFKDRLEQLAKDLDVTMTAVVIEAVDEYSQRRGGK
jgi:predicted transcriptional regulator